MRFYKIIATHQRTSNRFVYSTLGDFTHRGFHNEDANPRPIPFTDGVALGVAAVLQATGRAKLNAGGDLATLADYRDYTVTTERVDVVARTAKEDV